MLRRETSLFFARDLVHLAKLSRCPAEFVATRLLLLMVSIRSNPFQVYEYPPKKPHS